MPRDYSRDQFRECHETSGLQPVTAMPPLAGAVVVAKIGASLPTSVRGKLMKQTVRERASYPNAKVVARCLGQRRGSALEPCSHCQESPASGESGLDGLRSKHPTPEQLRKQHEQHVFALYSEDLLSPEAHRDAMRVYTERQEALVACKGKPLERQALLAEWRGYPVEPYGEVIGLLTDELWNADRD